MTDTREAHLLQLLRMERPPVALADELSAYPWDRAHDLVRLTVEHVAHALERTRTAASVRRILRPGRSRSRSARTSTRTGTPVLAASSMTSSIPSAWPRSLRSAPGASRRSCAGMAAEACQRKPGPLQSGARRTADQESTLLFFVAIFLIAGIAMTVAGRKLERDAMRAQGWPTVDGTLERCEVVERRGVDDDDSSWQLDVAYAYVVRGVSYRGTRFAFGHGGGSDDAPYRAIAEKLVHLPYVRVHYDPAHPAEAVLDTSVPGGLTYLGRVGFALAIVSAVLGTVRICS
jgi:hypothetical protein